MSYQLPERSHLVHKAIDIEKLSAKNKPELNEWGLPHHRLHCWQKKYDGCHVIVIIDHDLEVTFWSRDGKPVSSLGHHVPRLQRLPPGTVLFCEAWRYGAEFRKISGEFRRKSTQEQLMLVLFDTVRLVDFEAGVSEVPYSVRHKVCWDYATKVGHTAFMLAQRCEPWEVGELAQHPTGAYDGAVAKRWEGCWKAGAGTGGEVLKVKNVIDVDLLCTGVEEGEGKHEGRLGAIVCRYEDGVELRVGTGFNDPARVTYWNDPSKIVGHVVRVVGMKASGKGSLREPRFKGIRLDKTEADY